MKRIAAPMVGGMVSSTVLTLVVIPAIYSLWKEREVLRATGQEARTQSRQTMALRATEQPEAHR
jgi:Cu(I)/Ag(I) efflux system membrane protein CusA/SilA